MNKDIKKEISKLEENFCNNLKSVAEALNDVFIITKHPSCPLLSAYNLYDLAFDIEPELAYRYTDFEMKSDIKKEELSKLKNEAKYLSEKLNDLYPNVSVSSKQPVSSLLYTNRISFNDKIIYEYNSDKQQSSVDIFNHAHTFIINTEIMPEFSNAMKLLEKIDKIESKYGVNAPSFFSKLRLNKLNNSLNELPNNALFKDYFKLKDNKNTIFSYRSDLGGFRHNGMSYSTCLKQINSIKDELLVEKNKLKKDLNEVIKNNVVLKLINVYKNNLDYLYFFSEEHPTAAFESITLNSKLFNSNSRYYLESAGLFKDFANEIKKYELAENAYNSKKTNEDNWEPITDLNYIKSLNGKQLPDYVKINGQVVYINTSKAPFDKLSTDLQYKEFKNVQLQEEKLQKGEEE